MNTGEGVSIIIPAYNEQDAIHKVIKNLLDELKSIKINSEIIVVDDASTDKTLEILNEENVILLKNKKNLGYGASIKKGIFKSNFENIIIIDADGTYPVNRISDLIKHKDIADMSVCSRTSNNVKIPLIRKPAKFIINLIAQYLVGEKIIDLNSGFRIFKKNTAIKYFNLLSDRFSFTTSLTLCLLFENQSIKYIEIDYYSRTGKSKIIYRDFFSFIIIVFRVAIYFNPFRIFLPLSIIFFMLGILKMIQDIYFSFQKYDNIYLFFSNEVMSISSILFYITSINLFLFGLLADSISRRYNK